MKYILIFATFLFLGCNERKENQKDSLISECNLTIIGKEIHNFSHNNEGCKRSYTVVNTVFQNNSNDTVVLDLNFVENFCDFYDYPRIDVSQISDSSEITVLNIKKTKTPLKVLPMKKETIALYVNYNFRRTLRDMSDDLNKLAKTKTFFVLKTSFGLDTVLFSQLKSVKTNYYLDEVSVEPTDSISMQSSSSSNL